MQNAKKEKKKKKKKKLRPDSIPGQAPDFFSFSTGTWSSFTQKKFGVVLRASTLQGASIGTGPAP